MVEYFKILSLCELLYSYYLIKYKHIVNYRNIEFIDNKLVWEDLNATQYIEHINMIGMIIIQKNFVDKHLQ